MIKYTQNKIYLPLYSLTENNTCIVKLCRKQVLLACFIFQLVFLNLQNKTNRQTYVTEQARKKKHILKHIQHFRMKT